MNDTTTKDLAEIQVAFDQFLLSQPAEHPNAFQYFSNSVLEHFGIKPSEFANTSLFSTELALEIQQFAAAWLLRAQVRSTTALKFGNTWQLSILLFDRVFQNEIYKKLNIAGAQTFEKIQALTAHAEGVEQEVFELVNFPPELQLVTGIRERFQRLLFDRKTGPFLLPFLPRPLVNETRLASLFGAIANYADDKERDSINTRDAACLACEDYEKEACSYGTRDADSILGGLARGLKAAVMSHFESLEANEPPKLRITPVQKKYPLEQRNASIRFKVRIANEGTGPARDLRLDDVDSDHALQLETVPTSLGTLQAGDSFVVDIAATVTSPCSQADLLAVLSWARPAKRESTENIFTIEVQKADVDWESVDYVDSYSLEAVTSGDDLVGRENELERLLRVANSTNVDSSFLFGQKRVGKTSLANAVAERLASSSDRKWIIIKKGSGDYIGSDAVSTLQNLGDALVQAMKDRIPGLQDVPIPDFSKGLSRLSSIIDRVLEGNDLRLLFILDEFDELPLDLIEKTNYSTSLYLPIRQISEKPGCGFLLVGGERMRQILKIQGDRLNKFNPVQVDYFDRSNDWGDFAELIRRPVQSWLTINDAALVEWFTKSAGNPYFAKLLGKQVSANMASQRHSDASEFDIALAFETATASVEANSFAHFWTDGIVEDATNTKKIELERRSVLIATGQSFRKHENTTFETILIELKNVTGPSIGEEGCRHVLHDFVSRGVLTEDASGYFAAKIPLFSDWLTDRGVGELLADFTEMDYLRTRMEEEERLRITDIELGVVCERLGHYRGKAIEPSTVRQWLEQFGATEDQRLMYCLLFAINMYDEDKVRSKMREAFGIVARDIVTNVFEGERARRNIIVSYLDSSEAKSGPNYCRLFASENRIFHKQVQTLGSIDIESDSRHMVQRLVLVDDFSGTGNTIIEGLQCNLGTLQEINGRGIKILVVVMVGFAKARGRIESFIDDNELKADVYFCDELGDEDKAFSPTSSTFPTDIDRIRARDIAAFKGGALEKRHPLGFGELEGTIVFYQSCPNNTLPIFWSRNGEWHPLFPRI